jgi:pimeloyl-ACP methyl ester carboxylesterase
MTTSTASGAPGTLITIGDVEVELQRRGRGAPLLLLQSEDALEADSPIVTHLAAKYEVLIPSPPGFGRSNRPLWITCMDDVAYLYLDILDRFDLRDVTVVGFSLGGWIAAEMATKDDARFGKLVLVDPYGIKVGGPTDRDIADIYLLHPDEVAKRRWFDPQNGVRDYKALPEDELRIIARNRESLARFCWEPYMHNPKLRHRLHRIGVPTLLVWGENDGIVTPRYGEAYRELIPGAKLALVPEAGHLPHLEQRDRFLQHLDAFLGA